MFLVGGIQGAFGKWSGHYTTSTSGTNVWVITGNMAATRAVIVCSFFLSVGKCQWRILRLLFTFVFACS